MVWVPSLEGGVSRCGSAFSKWWLDVRIEWEGLSLRRSYIEYETHVKGTATRTHAGIRNSNDPVVKRMYVWRTARWETPRNGLLEFEPYQHDDPLSEGERTYLPQLHIPNDTLFNLLESPSMRSVHLLIGIPPLLWYPNRTLGTADDL